MHGQLGIFSYDEIEDKVQCHICGRWFHSVAAHVWQSHGWTADDYREEFGLNRNQSLICEGTRQKLSILNKQQGNWKNLSSQTMTEDELNRFLCSIRLKHGYRLRQQHNLQQSERIKQYNPMNEPEVVERRIIKEHEVWYGTSRQRALGRVNIQKAMNTLRARNLRDRKWVCKCGTVFPTREDLRIHQRSK